MMLNNYNHVHMGSFHSKCFSERAYSKRNVCYLFSPGTWTEYQTIRQGDLEKVRLLADYDY